MTPRPIVLDCDPGHDDAIAILLAHGCPDIELRAITTVAGNQTVEKTTLNARRVCTVAGIVDVPIAAGAGRPLKHRFEAAPDIHGESGLDGPRFPEPTVDVVGMDAADLIVQLTLEADPGELTLVPTGPLTNVATALERAPEVGPRLREIVLMGGSADRGNWTPAAEFNIWADPEAADIVFRSGVPVTMCGLNLTHQALATPDVMKRIAAVGTQVADVVVDLLGFFAETYRDVFGFGSPPVHDPCAVARVARPDLVGVRDAFVAVETTGDWTTGMTVVDLLGRLDRPANARVAMDLNVEGLWDLIVDALERIG
jgi:purine nucleosidase/pyrimidine-specific ribonucleoside hydrolase